MCGKAENLMVNQYVRFSRQLKSHKIRVVKQTV
jgi:hypothetical protein